MATNETYTYQQAKQVFCDLDLFESITLNVQSVSIFRKHLSEMIKRKASDKKFSSSLLDKNQLEVIRIK